MALFVNEQPVLGPLTKVNELSGYGAGTPVSNNYKPVTRHVVNIPVNVAAIPASGDSWAWEAPWPCQVVAARFNCTTISSDATPPTLQLYKVTADSTAPSSGTALFASAVNLHTIVANTRQEIGLTATAASLLMNAGDQLGITIGAHAATGLVGGNLQVEIVQLG